MRYPQGKLELGQILEGPDSALDDIFSARLERQESIDAW